MANNSLFLHNTARTDSTPGNISPLPIFTEEDFLAHWKRDVERAALSAATRAGLDRDEANDFAQEARIRLLVAFRQRGELQESHARTLIGHAVRSARRPTLRWISRFVPAERPTVIRNQDEGEDETLPADFAAPTGPDSGDKAAVERFIAGMSTRLSEVYDLLYVQGLTQQEAASRLAVMRQRVTQMHNELLHRGRGYFNCRIGQHN